MDTTPHSFDNELSSSSSSSSPSSSPALQPAIKTNSTASSPQIHASWKKVLHEEFHTPRMQRLSQFLKNELNNGKLIYPHPKNFFCAYNETPFEQVKVVIVGQDPYHGPGQAHGLSFSVPPAVPLPPSLLNIFKELKSDLGIDLRSRHPQPPNGCLIPWAKQGVLLLNAVLSVEAGRANSHQGKGWEEFTDRSISEINIHRTNVVFILWGAYAQKKGQHIDRTRHLVIESPHPSPLSASRGFFGSRPFSRTNAYLIQHGISPIDWSI